MIAINNLTVAFGGFTLLDNINFHISDGEHIALAGKNGAGKSTILKLIAGVQSPTGGSITKPNGITIGYLPQIMDYDKGTSVLDAAMSAFSDMYMMKERVEQITVELSERDDYESNSYSKLIEELNDINDRLNIIRSDSPMLLARKTLVGLGFKSDELERSRGTFSQGWNMRVELAKVLLRKPDVLLLDEPTNHLDIESIQWLEEYLTTYRGSLVLISHDRRFLDKVTTRTVEVVLGKIYDYKVPYSQYVILRKERMEQQRAAYENQQRMIEKSEEFIEKFRYKPTKSNQVQSRIKALEKIERIEIDCEDNSALNLKFPPAPRSGQIVFQATDLVAGYPDRKNGTEKVVFEEPKLTIERGEKVAFVGRNGEGKSTMMKLITGELEPLGGQAKVGYNVDLGYYAQNQEDVLKKEDTVFDTLDKVAVGDIRTRLRDILGAFLFKGEDIDKKVAVLSGGERSRLAMAKLILHPYNLLALDEPTNHMDIRSKDVLKQALQQYDGTLVIVSHDRDFLDGLVSKVYEFKDGKVKEYLGGVADFLEHRQIDSLIDLEMPVKPTASSKAVGSAADKAAPVKATPVKTDTVSASSSASEEGNKLSFEEQKEARRKQKQIENCEKKIASIESEMKLIEEKLSNVQPETDVDTLTREYLELKRTLDRKMEEWMMLSE